MNKQSLIEQITASQLSDERKQKILNLLADQDLNFDLVETIKDIIQEDIESDTAIDFTPEDYQAMEAITQQTAQDLQAVEDNLNGDLEFVENELGDLEIMVNDLNKTMDQVELDSVRSAIQQ